MNLSMLSFLTVFRPHWMPICLASLVVVIAAGCSPSSSPSPSGGSAEATSDPVATEATAPVDGSPEVSEESFDAVSYEASAEQLMAARLPIEQTTEGWVRLFDGHTLFGWVIAGEANWRIEPNEEGLGEIVVDRGQPCLMTTTSQWSDFELELQFQSDADTNSGVFVRTMIEPKDVETDCFEINIAPPDNPFPTGGVVKRKKGEPFAGEPSKWHTMNVVCEGEKLTVTIDGEVTCELDDAAVPAIGHIGLQHNSGAVRFRDIRLRPIGLTGLLDDSLSKWKQYEDMPGEFRVNDQGHLVVDGGKQQLESVDPFGDFAMLVDYQMEDPKSNSGIFFRSIPGDVMMGYECQVNNEIVDGNPLQPADCGAGGIFRRQDARIVAGEPGRWNSILLRADGAHFTAWVNGLQVTDVYDTRDPDVNPRKGLRMEPGTVIVQGHDPSTKATYRKIAIKDMAR